MTARHRAVPACTMLVASISSVPPADSGTSDGPFERNVIVVAGAPVGATASRMNVLPVAG